MKPIILGAGLAGLSAALALAPRPVILVSPYPLGEGCSSAWAQGGIAAAIGAGDHADFHARDTLSVGGGLNNGAIVRQVTTDAAAIIEYLVAQQVPFDRDDSGALRMGLEAGHKKRRIIHAQDATGAAVMRALIDAVRVTPSIEVIEGAVAQDIITDKGVRGVVLRRGRETATLATNSIILATGGAAALWHDTTNPRGNWGSGLALAARAGAALGDLEFMQFHPTALSIDSDPLPLISETVRGEGAILIDEKGINFTDALQPRDIVARAIWQHRAAGHRVFLDATRLRTRFAAQFPTIEMACRAASIDPALQPIPVRPAAHYHMGGVLTDARGRTNIKGLWACGEVACTGLHGANRLASNSLLEAASFGKRVAEDIEAGASIGHDSAGANVTWIPDQSTFLPGHKNSFSAKTEEVEQKIRVAMSEYVGVVRDSAGLQQAVNLLSPLAAQSDMALTGLMIAQSALRREESRGAHYRRDFAEMLPVAARSVFPFTDQRKAS